MPIVRLSLQHYELAVFVKVPVERDHLIDSHALHDCKADCVTQGVGFVLVSAHNPHTFSLITLGYTFNVATWSLNAIEEGNGIIPSSAGTGEYESISLDNNQVCGHEISTLRVSTLKQQNSMLVKGILSH